MTMKLHLACLFALPLLLGSVACAAPNRCALGLVGSDVVPDPEHPAPVEVGVRVQSLLPGGSAELCGLQVGDVIVTMDGKPVHSRAHLAARLSRRNVTDTVRLEVMRNGHRRVVNVQLMRAPNRAATMQNYLDTAVGGDRVMRPLNIPDEAREKLKTLRAEVCRQLSLLPESIDTEKLTDTLQAIRDLARDLNARNGKRWMEGRAGESSMRFRDDEGGVMILGANNLLTVEVFDLDGKVVYHSNIDTPEQRAAIPPQFLQRIQNLK